MARPTSVEKALRQERQALEKLARGVQVMAEHAADEQLKSDQEYAGLTGHEKQLRRDLQLTRIRLKKKARSVAVLLRKVASTNDDIERLRSLEASLAAEHRCARTKAHERREHVIGYHRQSITLRSLRRAATRQAEPGQNGA